MSSNHIPLSQCILLKQNNKTNKKTKIYVLISIIKQKTMITIQQNYSIEQQGTAPKELSC